MIDSLLAQSSSSLGSSEFSEDSEEDEDTENAEDARWEICYINANQIDF